MPSTHEVDVAVIGAGTAGLSAYRAAKREGANAVLIEGGPYGTTCARVGCMPSKLLIAAAEAAHHAKHSDLFGVHVGDVQVDGRAVMHRVRTERDRFVGFVVRGTEAIDVDDRLLGYAEFLDDHTLQIEDRRVVAKRIVLAVGSRPRSNPALDALGSRRIVNDDIFDWEDLPTSVLVLGLGVIGLELGQALARLGVRVRVLGRSGKISALSHPELNRIAIEAFRDDFPIFATSKIHAMQARHDGVHVDIEAPAGRRLQDHFEYVLAAIGRASNLDQLHLERTSLSLNTHGLPDIDPYTLQAGNSHIFIAGDANMDRPLLHEASDEGRIAGHNAAHFPTLRQGLRRSPLSIIFTDPQIASVGETWSTLQQQDIVTGFVSFDDQGRSRVAGMNRGALVLFADACGGRFRGAEMAGPRAEHLGHLLAWAHQQKLSVKEMLEMPFYHPVVEEGLRTALRDAASKIEAAKGRCEALDCPKAMHALS